MGWVGGEAKGGPAPLGTGDPSSPSLPPSLPGARGFEDSPDLRDSAPFSAALAESFNIVRLSYQANR